MTKESISEAKRTFIGIFFVYIIVSIVIYTAEVFIFTEGEDASKFYFWTQFITGSSWPSWEEFDEKYPLCFSFAAALHIMLNVVPLLGITWVWLNLLRQRGEKMEIVKALKLRDMAIKAQIKGNVFPKIPRDEHNAFSKILDDIFEQSEDPWKKDLTIMIGEERAKGAQEYIENGEI